MPRAIREKVSDIFKSVGQPTITYVHRQDADYENSLKAGLHAGGQICLITGPSKTGKTTLYNRVLAELELSPLVVRCDEGLSATEFWAKALESINFERLAQLQEASEFEVSSKTTLSGKIGWAWLASLMGEASLGVGSTSSDTEVKEKILSRPSPQHLIPVLKKLPLCLVVEDYHYLQPETQRIVFQQWKSFVDEEVSVIILGTTHRAIDIIAANKDLLARVRHIEISRWDAHDLKQIVTKGFAYLEIDVPDFIKEILARESVGIPIVTQQACQQLFVDKGVFEHERGSPFATDRNDVEKALTHLAATTYSSLENQYNRLVTGPRKSARRYNTYEYILSCFAQEPITFSLQRHEIDERLKKINISGEKRPPPPSVNSTLNALGRFQARADLKLLEWRATDNVLYMLEPLFLFYLRWRHGRRTRTPLPLKLDRILDMKIFESVQNALFMGFTLHDSLKDLPKLKDVPKKADD